MKLYIIICFFILLMSGCGKESTEPEVQNRISFSPGSSSSTVGEAISIGLKIENFSTPVFAISLQILYNENIIKLNESDGFIPGSFFSSNSVSFVKTKGYVIYLSVTCIQGEKSVQGSGELGRLNFTAIHPGDSNLIFSQSDVCFYDASGLEIDISNIIFEDGIININ